jgi:hypothetical protein
MTRDDELERRIRAAADTLQSAAPSAVQLERILARRARGERVTLPAASSRPGRPALRWFMLGAAAAAVLLLAYFPSLLDGPSPPIGPQRPDTMAVVGSGKAEGGPGTSREWRLVSAVPLMAQTSIEPKFPVLGASTGLRLRPGRWVYTTQPPRDEAPYDSLLVYSVSQSQVGERPAWLLLAGKQLEDGPTIFAESTWVAREEFEILAYHEDTLSHWRPVPAGILALLQGSDLSLDWKGSAPLLQSSQEGVVVRRWWNLRVYGTEKIDVPAGRFSCWKVGFSPSNGFFFWISRNGWPVRQGMSREDDLAYGKMNLFLVSGEDR